MGNNKSGAGERKKTSKLAQFESISFTTRLIHFSSFKNEEGAFFLNLDIYFPLRCSIFFAGVNFNKENNTFCLFLLPYEDNVDGRQKNDQNSA